MLVLTTNSSNQYSLKQVGFYASVTTKDCFSPNFAPGFEVQVSYPRHKMAQFHSKGLTSKP
jgi:hypothetical protein